MGAESHSCYPPQQSPIPPMIRRVGARRPLLRLLPVRQPCARVRAAKTTPARARSWFALARRRRSRPSWRDPGCPSCTTRVPAPPPRSPPPAAAVAGRRSGRQTRAPRRATAAGFCRVWPRAPAGRGAPRTRAAVAAAALRVGLVLGLAPGAAVGSRGCRRCSSSSPPPLTFIPLRGGVLLGRWSGRGRLSRPAGGAHCLRCRRQPPRRWEGKRQGAASRCASYCWSLPRGGLRAERSPRAASRNNIRQRGWRPAPARVSAAGVPHVTVLSPTRAARRTGGS